jgi:hypothetical protein
MHTLKNNIFMENQNTGVLPIKIKPTDWISGVEGITYQEVLPSGDWTPYLPTYEPQEKIAKTQACVTYSMWNSIETQIKFHDGKETNYSDRYTAKMSNTTKDGNQLFNPPYSLTHDGWLLEEDYSFPNYATFDEYYAEIPQTLKDKAKKNYENANWTIQYEWINTGNCQPDLEVLKYHLKQAPLQIATSYNAGTCVAEHAMLLYKISDYLYIYDSYRGGIIKQPMNYPLPFVLKIVVVPKPPTYLMIPPLTKNLWVGMPWNLEVVYLQRKLIKLKYLSAGLDTGLYRNLTQQAVYKFQKDYKVASLPVLWWNRGRYVYQNTRKALNNL